MLCFIFNTEGCPNFVWGGLNHKMGAKRRDGPYFPSPGQCLTWNLSESFSFDRVSLHNEHVMVGAGQAGPAEAGCKLEELPKMNSRRAILPLL